MLLAERRREEAQDVEMGARAVRMIVAEHARRLKDARRSPDLGVLERLRGEHPTYLVIARLHSGTYLVLEPANGSSNVFVHESKYTARGRLKERREWVLPGPTRPKSWIVLAQSRRWESWDLNADEREYLRDPEVEAFLEDVRSQAAADEGALALAWDGNEFKLWRRGDDPVFNKERLLTGLFKSPTVKECERTWKRPARRRAPVLQKWSWESELSLSRDRLPWERMTFSPVDEDDKPQRPHCSIIWSDEGRIKDLRDKLENFEVVASKRDEMHRYVRAFIKGVEDEWLRRAWLKEKERFDEDFGDPELWEAHRKSKERHIVYPFHRQIDPESWRNNNSLRDALKRLIEAGTDPEGWTVARALKEATERFGAEDSHEKKNGAVIPITFQAPDELLDFVLSAKTE